MKQEHLSTCEKAADWGNKNPCSCAKILRESKSIFARRGLGVKKRGKAFYQRLSKLGNEARKRKRE